jgi:single-strand DNA-binding protein
MYRNSVSLIGFAGKDAETRTTKNQKSYTVLSLATQSSYKDKKTGDYVNRTEWHRVIACERCAPASLFPGSSRCPR